MRNIFTASQTVAAKFPVCEQSGSAPMPTLEGRGLPSTGGATAQAYASKPLPISTLPVAIRLNHDDADGRVPPRGRPV